MNFALEVATLPQMNYFLFAPHKIIRSSIPTSTELKLSYTNELLEYISRFRVL